ncbi:MAG TPA: MFS transporter [Hanamia sp.]|nr:MFS transporter [Hanamia sp.]
MTLPFSNAINTEKRLPSGAWLVVALLFIVGLLNYLDRITITTMRVSIIKEIPMTEADFGILTSVFLWVYGFLSPFAGFIADRFKRSRVIIVSLFVWSTVTWLTSYATTFEQLLATRALMGISEACFIPASLALIMDYHRGSTRSLATGILMCGNMLGSSLGFVGGWIAENHSWHWAFHIFGIIGIVYSLVLIFFLRDIPQIEKEPDLKETKTRVNFFEAMKDLFSSRSFIFLLIFWGLLGMVTWIIMGWLPTFYQEHFNLTQARAGLYATGYFYPASIAGLLLGGFWADYWNKTNARSRILVPVIGLCIAAPCVFFASSVTVLPLTILFFFGYGLTRMFSDTNLMPVLCLVADSRYRATGYGVLNLISTVLGGIGLYAAGAMRDLHIDLSVAFKFASLLLLVCAVLFYLVKPRNEK